jgi:hypothetical protein
MLRVIALSLAVLLVAPVVVGAASVPQLTDSSTGGIIFYDDFEAHPTGSLTQGTAAPTGSWSTITTGPGSSVQVVTSANGVNPYEGSKFLQLSRGNGDCIAQTAGISSRSVDNTVVKLQIAFRIDGPSGTWPCVVFSPMCDAYELAKICVTRIGDVGVVEAWNGSSWQTLAQVANATLANNVWNTMTIVRTNGVPAVSYGSDYQISINDQDYEHVPYINTPSWLPSVAFTGIGINVQSGITSVDATSGPADAWLTPKASEGFSSCYEMWTERNPLSTTNWRKNGTATNPMTGGRLSFANVATNNYDGGAYAGKTSSAWSTAVTFEKGFTIEVRLKTNQQVTGSSFGLLASGGPSTMSAAFLHIKDSALLWGPTIATATQITGGTLHNNVAFHTYRIAKLPGQDSYFVWFDGGLEGAGLTSASSTAYGNYVAFGNGVTTDEQGTNELQYVRFAPGAFAPVQPSHGRQVILNRGIQLEAMVCTDQTNNQFNNYTRWNSAGFTTANFFRDYSLDGTYSGAAVALPNLPSGQQWSRVFRADGGSDTGYQLFNGQDGQANETAYQANLASFHYADEVSLVSNGVWDTATLGNMKSLYKDWRTAYPNALIYTNFWCFDQLGGNSAPGNYDSSGTNMTGPNNLTYWMQYTKPDAVSFDWYSFPYANPPDADAYSFDAAFRNYWYWLMTQYRNAGMQGYDGTGQQPLVCAVWAQMCRYGWYGAATPPESFVRLQQFASWAFGYQKVSSFVYNTTTAEDASLAVMFSDATDDTPTSVFTYVQNANAESKNLGNALKRLKNTGVFIVNGPSPSTTPWGMTPWSSGCGATNAFPDYLTSVTRRSGATGDILVGYFVPAFADNSDYTYADGQHFMIVNGKATGTAAASQMTIRLRFNVGSSGFVGLERVNRSNGVVTQLTFSQDATGKYYDVVLPGGTGDLFRYR